MMWCSSHNTLNSVFFLKLNLAAFKKVEPFKTPPVWGWPPTRAGLLPLPLHKCIFNKNITQIIEARLMSRQPSPTPNISYQGPELLTVCWPLPATRVCPNSHSPHPSKSHVWHTIRSASRSVCVSAQCEEWWQRPRRAEQETVNVRLSRPHSRSRDGSCLFEDNFSHEMQPTSHRIDKGARFSWRANDSSTLQGHGRSNRLWQEPPAFITSRLFIFLLSG